MGCVSQCIVKTSLQTLKMKTCYVSCLLLALMAAVQSVMSAPVIHAPWGALRGVDLEGDAGRKMNGYLGVPYAVPPVGEMRFTKPEAHPGLEKGEVFEADKIMPACPQKPVLIGTRQTSEDCLMLDVYVPAEDDPSTPKPYAVMVFIHGGGFSLGDAYSYRPSKLVVDGQVIVVVIQYRLGVLGFISSGDDTIPENLGLWDQNLALRWVQQNIAAFGGDTDQVTIFGESAGSMSVGFHLIIPQSKGLFKRAIMQSGSPQDISEMAENLDKKTIFKGLAEKFDCQGDNSQELLTCLRQQPVDHLLNKSTEYEMTSPLMTYFFPAVDGDLITQNLRQLAQDPDFMQENGVGNVDVVLGFNKDEGAMIILLQKFAQLPPEALYTAEFFRSITNVCFTLMGFSNSTALKQTAEFFYRGADFSSNVSQSLDPLVNMYGDCLMNAAITEWARYLAAAPHAATRYLYIVDHEFASNSQGPIPGAHHGDELFVLFDVDREYPEDSIFAVLNKTSLSTEELALSAALVKAWTTFAKTGNPNAPTRDSLSVNWPQFTTEEEEYLSISQSPRVVPKMGPYRDRVALWLHLLPELDSLISQMAPEEATKEPPSPREEL